MINPRSGMLDKILYARKKAGDYSGLGSNRSESSKNTIFVKSVNSVSVVTTNHFAGTSDFSKTTQLSSIPTDLQRKKISLKRNIRQFVYIVSLRHADTSGILSASTAERDSLMAQSQKETVPETVPPASPPVPASIPAASPLTGHRPKTTTRKKAIALPGPEGSTLIGATSKGVTFLNHDAQQKQASAVPLSSSEGHAKGKHKSKAAGSTKTKKTKVTSAKCTSSISDSTPLSKFKLKEKINPPPCTSSKDVSPEMEDSLPELDPSLIEPILEEPHDDFEEETKSETNPSETTTVASEPKGITPLTFPELSTKSTKQKGFSPTKIAKALNLVPIKIDDYIEFAKDQVLSELVGQSMVWEPKIKDDNAPTTARKVKGINLAGSGSGDVEPDTSVVPTTLASIQTGIASLSERFTAMEDTQRQIMDSLAIINASTTPAP
ncbi:uncharacterized protein LOC133815388 [Humulus lupulus]|uniref:uncharacterized protein LOC133815388 n=1 Tax=Humulus lupulus TaxID=3486 RepID=UPI002B402759|nr:uncharacterized protein LOC133815388 [Humulus lupulus]